MNINILKNQITQKDIKTLYLFYGPEDYLKNYYVNTILDIIVDKNLRTLNKVVLDDKIEVSKIIDNCETLPVFSEKKLVLIKKSGFFKGEGNKEDLEKLVNYFKDLPSFLCLIFYEDNVDKRLRPYKTINKEGLVVEFPYQKPADLARWVIKVLKSYDKEISMDTASAFVERTGEEMTEILNEIEKLVAYSGERKTIEMKDIKDVCSVSVKSRIFDLTDAIVEKDVVASFGYLDDMLSLREPIPMIIFMIARQFRQILQTKMLIEDGANSRQIASTLKVTPYIARKIQERSEGFNLEKLKNNMESIFECDLSIKTGKMKDRTAIDLLITKLLE